VSVATTGGFFGTCFGARPKRRKGEKEKGSIAEMHRDPFVRPSRERSASRRQEPPHSSRAELRSASSALAPLSAPQSARSLNCLSSARRWKPNRSTEVSWANVVQAGRRQAAYGCLLFPPAGSNNNNNT